jgi:phosphoglycolate phosphatase
LRLAALLVLDVQNCSTRSMRSCFDVVAARANGLRAVGVLWGYGSERELREAGAERLCATPVELPAVIAQLSVRGS